MLDHARALDLADRLRDAGYTLDAVTDRLGQAATDALGRNTTFAARDALGAADDRQATLARLFLLHDALPAERVRAALGDAEPLVDAGILAPDGPHGQLRAAIEIRPYAAGPGEGGPTGGKPGGGSQGGPGESGADAAFDGWVAHDLLPTLDGRIAAPRPDFVLGLSPASTTLTQLTIRRPVARALDLGTGCGVQALHLSRHAGHVVATDLNPRAIAFAALTSRLNGVDLDLRTGSLYEPVAGEELDLIVTNPPFVIAPPSATPLTYREGTLPGDELVRQVVADGARRLAPGGTLQVLGNWAVPAGRPWEERVSAWVPPGFDAWFVERERLDPYAYVEIWLADAGLTGTPAYAPRYAAWVEHLRDLGIAGVSLGWIVVHRSGRPTPDVTCETWPHAVHQPLGEAFAAHQSGVSLADRPDAALLAAAWRVDPRVDAETIGRPGAPDPEHIVLRQRYGFGRAVEVDTALAAIVGACDGDLAASVLVDAVAQLLDVDAAALAAEVAPKLRALVREGYLTEA